MENEHVERLIVIDRSAQERVMELAGQHDVQVEVPTSRGFEPVMTATLLLLGGASAVATVVYLVDKEKGGQIIDLREGSARAFYRSKDVTYGLVVLIAKDGSATVEVREPKGMFGIVVQSLTEVLAGFINEEIGKISSIAMDAVEGRATVQLDVPNGNAEANRLEP